MAVGSGGVGVGVTSGDTGVLVGFVSDVDVGLGVRVGSKILGIVKQFPEIKSLTHSA